MNDKLREAIATVLDAGLAVTKEIGQSTTYSIVADETSANEYMVYTENEFGTIAPRYNSFGEAIEAFMQDMPHGYVMSRLVQ